MKSILLLMCLTWAVLAHEPGLPVISGPTEEIPVTFIPAQPTMPAEQPQMMPEQPQPMPAQPMPEHMPMMPMRPIENPVQCPAIEVQQSVLKVSDALEDGAILHKIKFQTPTNTDGIAWVDVHFSINNGQQLNFRMQKISDKLFEFAPVAMRAGDVLNYKFTYCVMLMTSQGQIDCDTETFTFSVPAHIEAPVAPPAECRDIQWTQALAPTGVTMDGTTLHKFVWTAKTPIAMSGFVDLHYRIGHDTDFVNVRMTKLSETTWEFAGVPVKAGETVEYFYTFCILLPTNQRIDCDTNIMTYTPNARKTQFISKSMQNINAEASSSMSMSSNFAPILEVQPRALTAAELAYLQAYPQAGRITAGLALDESDGDFSGEEAIAADNDARNERRGRVVFDADGSGIDEDQYAQVAAAPAEPVAAATQAARASFARSYSAAPSSLYGVSIEHADL